MTRLDAHFFKPFVDGTINTIKTMTSYEVSPLKPFIKGSREQPEFAIAGVIGLTSSAFNGSITLCFPKKVFLGIISRMLGEDFKEITEDMQDGAAELLNIIYGHAKAILNNQGYTIQKAIPTVIVGNALKTTHLGRNPTMVLAFETELGELHVEISSESNTP